MLPKLTALGYLIQLRNADTVFIGRDSEKNTFGHWESGTVLGKKTKGEPATFRIVERLTGQREINDEKHHKKKATTP